MHGTISNINGNMPMNLLWNKDDFITIVDKAVDWTWVQDF